MYSPNKANDPKSTSIHDINYVDLVTATEVINYIKEHSSLCFVVIMIEYSPDNKRTTSIWTITQNGHVCLCLTKTFVHMDHLQNDYYIVPNEEKLWVIGTISVLNGNYKKYMDTAMYVWMSCFIKNQPLIRIVF